MIGSLWGMSGHFSPFRVGLRKARTNNMSLPFLLFSWFCLFAYSLFCFLPMACNLSPGLHCSYEGISLLWSVEYSFGYGREPEAPILHFCCYHVPITWGRLLAFVLSPAYSWRKEINVMVKKLLKTTKTVQRLYQEPHALYIVLLWGTFLHSVLHEWRHVGKSKITRSTQEGRRQQAGNSYCEKLACLISCKLHWFIWQTRYKKKT